ncbi:MAG: thiamine pyrophosphate-dependent enzyme, partial [Pseudomonadota bacterium]
LETARRHHINLVVLVNNNSGLNQEITLNQVAYDGKPRGGWKDMWTFTDINFAKIAEGFGCVGIRVEQPGEIRDAIQRAFGMNKPVVIDVVSDVNVLARRVPH